MDSPALSLCTLTSETFEMFRGRLDFFTCDDYGVHLIRNPVLTTPVVAIMVSVSKGTRKVACICLPDGMNLYCMLKVVSLVVKMYSGGGGVAEQAVPIPMQTDGTPPSSRGGAHNMHVGETSKKPRISWDAKLHEIFLNAVNKIGLENASPKKILVEMNVPGLTREHVASHLQKYRKHMTAKRVQKKRVLGGNGSTFIEQQPNSSAPPPCSQPEPCVITTPAVQQHAAPPVAQNPIMDFTCLHEEQHSQSTANTFEATHQDQNLYTLEYIDTLMNESGGPLLTESEAIPLPRSNSLEDDYACLSPLWENIDF